MPSEPGGKNNVRDVSVEQARRFLAARSLGDHALIDVRQPWEYEESRIPGAALYPLPDLADRLGELAPGAPVVVYCRSGRRSAAAASLLLGQGFTEVMNLTGGIEAWNDGPLASGALDQGMLLLDPSASPADILALAFVMEDTLARQYRELAGKTSHPEAASTLLTLAGFEERHKNLVRALYRRIAPHGPELEEAAKSMAPVTESGKNLDEYLIELAVDVDDPLALVELALSVEVQALDLYMRYARAALPGEEHELLLSLAGEEKGHLKVLGTLSDRLAKELK